MINNMINKLLQVLVCFALFYLTMQFGIYIGRDNHRMGRPCVEPLLNIKPFYVNVPGEFYIPQTLWNHGCSMPHADLYVGTNIMVWHCGCGKSGTNAYPVESSAELKPWFTNVPPK